MIKKWFVWLHWIAAIGPLVILFIIISYFYIAYMTVLFFSIPSCLPEKTYLIKLLNDAYPYDHTQDITEGYNESMFIGLASLSPYTTGFANMLQKREFSSQQKKGLLYFAIAHILAVLLLVSIFRTMLTPPGNVSQGWNRKAEEELQKGIKREKENLKKKWIAKRKQQAKGAKEDQDDEQWARDLDEELKADPQTLDQFNQIAFYNAMKKGKKRFCAHCQKFKPERAHHCRQCNVCVLRMDHHCPWVCNCIGFYNYKFFYNMVFYGSKTSMLWFIIVTYHELVSDMLYDDSADTKMIYFVLFTFMSACLLGLILTGFFCFHTFLILTGRTTLEFVEDKRRVTYSLGSKLKLKEYDRGIWTNLQTMLGSILFWCCPFVSHHEGDGVTFEKSNIDSIELDEGTA